MSENSTEGSEISLKSEIAVEKDPVLEKFRKGELLVRVLDPPGIKRGEKGLELDFGILANELDLMGSNEGMPKTSSTLLVKGIPIPMYYKSMGFLFDPDKVEITNVNSHDSYSGTAPTSLKSLDELRDFYSDKKGVQDMNEVVITARMAGIVGMVIREKITSPASLASLEATKQYMKAQGLDLQIYEYNEREGKMKKYESPDMNYLLPKISSSIRSAYEKALL